MKRFFEFSDGRNIMIETDTFEGAVNVIKEEWWSDIFEECDFRVTTVNACSFKRNNLKHISK
jgi:hypothetical protein